MPGLTRSTAVAVVLAVSVGLLTLGAPVAIAVFGDRDLVDQNTAVTEDLEPGQNLAAGPCLLNTVSTDIDITWDPTPSSGQQYRVLRATESGGPYTEVATVDLGVTSYVDADVQVGTTYYYVVRTTYENWVSQDSNEASAELVDTC